MRSHTRMGLAPLLLLASLSLGGCLSVGGKPIVNAPTASPCSDLIPADWLKGVPGADLPPDDSQASWIKFGDAQTAQLDKANDRQTATVHIVKGCEARDAAAYKSLTAKPWWRFW